MKFEIQTTGEGLECHLVASGSVKDIAAWLSQVSKTWAATEKALASEETSSKTSFPEGKEYFSPKELAGFMDMPDTPRGVRIKAKKHFWTNRKRNGQGGGREYHISNFSPEVQEALRRCS